MSARRGKAGLVLGLVLLAALLAAARGLPLRRARGGASAKERSSKLAEVGELRGCAGGARTRVRRRQGAALAELHLPAPLGCCGLAPLAPAPGQLFCPAVRVRGEEGAACGCQGSPCTDGRTSVALVP